MTDYLRDYSWSRVVGATSATNYSGSFPYSVRTAPTPIIRIEREDKPVQLPSGRQRGSLNLCLEK